MLRSAMSACAAAMIASAAAPVFADAPAERCAETNFRIYFAQGSTTLDAAALAMLDAAERNVAGCAYSEVHVMVDAASVYASVRGEAILAALNNRAWDVARVEPRAMRRVAMSGAPEYAEVLVTPRALPALDAPVVAERETGV